MPRAKLLGKLLVDAGVITSKALEELLATHKGDKRKLGELLVEKKLVKPDQLAQDREKIQKYVATSGAFTGFAGKVSFNPDGDAIKSFYIVVGQGGKWADDRDDFTCGDFEFDGVQRDHAAELLADAGQTEEWLRCVSHGV